MKKLSVRVLVLLVLAGLLAAPAFASPGLGSRVARKRMTPAIPASANIKLYRISVPQSISQCFNLCLVPMISHTGAMTASVIPPSMANVVKSLYGDWPNSEFGPPITRHPKKMGTIKTVPKTKPAKESFLGPPKQAVNERMAKTETAYKMGPCHRGFTKAVPTPAVRKPTRVRAIVKVICFSNVGFCWGNGIGWSVGSG